MIITVPSVIFKNIPLIQQLLMEIADYVGSIEVGKLADLVLWEPAFWVKPKLIIKGGFIAVSKMGDPNASIPTPQPVYYRNMFGAFGRI